MIIFQKYRLINNNNIFIGYSYEYETEKDLIKINILGLKKKKYIDIIIFLNGILKTNIQNGILQINNKIYGKKSTFNCNSYGFFTKRKINKKINNFLKDFGILDFKFTR